MFLSTRKTRLRRWLVGILLTIIVASLSELGVSNLLARQLRTLVADRLDAELTVGRLWYIPPFGVYVSDASLWRDQERIASIGATRLRLARVPLPHRPIVIQRLSIEAPILQLTRTAEGLLGGPGLLKARPTTRKGPAKNLSDVLQLRHLRVARGRVVYFDRRPAEPLPMVWNDINIDVDLTQQSPSNYNFELTARHGTCADAKAAGTFDVDSLLLSAQNVQVKLTARRDSSERALPAPIQRLLEEYEVSGELDTAATATVPLRDVNNAAYTATLTLQRASAWLPISHLALDDANLQIQIEQRAIASTAPATKPAAPRLLVRLIAFDAIAAGSQFKLDRGRASINLSEQTWSLDGVSGHITLHSPTTLPNFKARDVMARLRPTGHIDFTATGAGPMLLGANCNPSERVADYLIVAYPQNLSFSLPDFPLRIERAGGGSVRLQYGVLTLENLAANYGNDVYRLARARIPLNTLPKTVLLQEIAATATLNPPLEPYPPGFMKLLEDSRPRGTFAIGGNAAINTTTRPAKADYNLMVCSDAAAFELTSRRVPLTNVRSDVTITPLRITASKIEAELFGGKLTANGFFEPGDVQHYGGEVSLQHAQLKGFDELFRPKNAGRRPNGETNAHASFSGDVPRGGDPLDSLQSAGELEIIRGELFHIPVLTELLQAVHTSDAIATVGEAAASFTIHDRTISLKDIAINSPTVGLQGSGDISFDGKIDFEAIVAPLANWKDKMQETKIPLVSNVAGEIVGGVQKLLNSATSNLLYEFRVQGTLKDPQIKPVPAPILSDTAALVFGRMVQGVRDGELMKTVREATNTALHGKPVKKREEQQSRG
jgi:hypothetical protein